MKIPWLLDYRFGSPWWLLLLLLLPLFSVLRGKWGRAPSIMFPTVHLVRDLARPARSAAGWFSIGLTLLSLAAAIIAMARPQKVLSIDDSKAEGIAICLTVDVSLSMRTPDFKIGGVPTDRITAAKRVMRDFIRGRTNDRIGIVAFAGAPYLPCPMTLDHEWLENNIERVQLGVTADGTAIGSGIAAAARRLDLEKGAKSKVLVLITDGANNSGRLSPQDAARLGATLGVKIYTIGIGTAVQQVIPLPDGRTINSHRLEFDEDVLKEVAHIGSGEYYRAQDIDALKRIFQTIDQLEKTEVHRRTTIETKEAYHPFALCAAALLGLAMLARTTVLRAAPALAE
jgi:Ca-activated chloride channel family protein